MNNETLRPKGDKNAEQIGAPITPLDRVRVVDQGIRAVDAVQGLHPDCVVIIKNATTGTTIRGDKHPKNGEKRIRVKHSPDF